MSLNVNKITVFITAICSGLITLGLVSATVSALEYQSNPVDIKFEFGSTLTINTDGNIAISNLTPGTANVSSSSYRVTVNTNNVAGYTLTATVGCSSGTDCYNNKTLSDGTNTFSMVASTSGTALTAGEWGFTTSGSATATSSVFKTLALYSDTTPTTLNKTKNATGTAYDSTYVGNNTTPFQIGAYAANNQVAGTYTNVINFSAVANPIPEYTVTLSTSNADTIIIDGVSYTNGDTPSLTQGIHTVSGTYQTSFESWSATGSVSVANSSAESTTITVTGAGTLTLTGVAPPPGLCTSIATCMQTVTSASCPTSGTTLTDARDGNTYTVKKLADACWMTQNLRYLGDTGSSAGTMVIGGSYSNAANKSITLYSLDSSDAQYFGAYTNHCDTTNGYNYACVYDSGDTTTGVWYNYYVASAGTISTNSNSTMATSDICPAGWHLPSRYLFNNSPAGSINSILSQTTAFSPITGGNYNYGGHVNLDSGYWWTSTSADGNGPNRDTLSYDGSELKVFIAYRYGGRYIRCVRTS